MKTMIAMIVVTMTGCAQLQSFVGMTPTECESSADRIVERAKKVTAQMCASQVDYKARATILDAALDTVAK